MRQNAVKRLDLGGVNKVLELSGERLTEYAKGKLKRKILKRENFAGAKAKWNKDAWTQLDFIERKSDWQHFKTKVEKLKGKI